MKSSEWDLQLTRATTLHQQGSLSQAEAIYRQLWRVRQDDNLAYLLGTLRLQQEDAQQAVEFLAPVAARQPHSADLHNNLGVAYQTLKQREPAIKSFQAALKANAEYPQAYQNLGKLLFEIGYLTEAEKCYQAAVSLLSGDHELRQDWVNVLNALHRWEDSARELETLLQSPTLSATQKVNLQISLAYAYSQLRRYEDAIPLCEQILRSRPGYTEILSNLSYLYEHVGRIDEAIETAERALSVAPQSAEVYNNLGVALRSAHRFEDSLAAFQKATELRDDCMLAHFNEGSTQLLLGQYPAGWQGYESRLNLVPAPADLSPLPRWSGEAIPGKRLLVVCDQGYGDALQFARFLPRIRQQSQALLIWQVPPELRSLLEASRIQGEPLADEWISEEEPLPHVDGYFPLMSAGVCFQLQEADFAFSEPYLQAPAAAATGQNAASDYEGNRPLAVGLCWRGNAGQAQDHVRSTALSQWHSLADIPGVRWVSFQLDATADELSAWPGTLENRGASLTSFAETAQLLEEVDLLITVDTAVAHLAGSLGRPVWTLLPHTPDWRWHLERTDSPWYPGMRLYRQPQWGDWSAVMAQVEQDLRQQAR